MYQEIIDKIKAEFPTSFYIAIIIYTDLICIEIETDDGFFSEKIGDNCLVLDDALIALKERINNER